MRKAVTGRESAKPPQRPGVRNPEIRDPTGRDSIVRGGPIPRSKTRLTMYLDTAVVEYFRSRSGGRGYQTLINEALKQAIERENLEDVLRRVIREEARPHRAAAYKAATSKVTKG